MGTRFRSGCDKAAQRYVLNLASSRTGLVLIVFALLAWSLVLYKIGGALHRSVAATSTVLEACCQSVCSWQMPLICRLRTPLPSLLQVLVPAVH